MDVEIQQVRDTNSKQHQSDTSIRDASGEWQGKWLAAAGGGWRGVRAVVWGLVDAGACRVFMVFRGLWGMAYRRGWSLVQGQVLCVGGERLW